jgi:hypothetical protein
MLEKKNSFFIPAAYERTDAFSLEMPSLSTQETHLPFHGLSPCVFEEGLIMVLLKLVTLKQGFGSLK